MSQLGHFRPYHGRSAVEAGLADACRYPDELEDALRALGPAPASEGEPEPLRWVEAPVYHALRVRDPGWLPLSRDLPRLGYVVAHGAVRRGRGPRGVACDDLRDLLERLRRDESVRGVALRLDSPGGDALASDLLWRAVLRLEQEKPVVVTMGDVAASGGYYVSVAANALLAEPGTLTGSIGAVTGKLDLAGLYGRIGVGREGVERGARAGLLTESRGFSADERRAVRDSLAAVYQTFTDRVAEGRGLDPGALDRAAQGRIWSGRRARELGLVDALGGPLEALAELRRRAGLAPEEPVAVDVHPRTPRLGGLRSLLRWLPRPGAGA